VDPPVDDFSPPWARPDLLVVLVPDLLVVLVPDFMPVLVLDLLLELTPVLVLLRERTEVSPREMVVRERTDSLTPTPTRWPCRITTLAPPWQPWVQRCSHGCQCRYDRQWTSAVLSMASVATRTPAGEVEVMAMAPDEPTKPARPAAAAKMKTLRMRFLQRFLKTLPTINAVRGFDVPCRRRTKIRSAGIVNAAGGMNRCSCRDPDSARPDPITPFPEIV
jgi:hypothetical protein